MAGRTERCPSLSADVDRAPDVGPGEVRETIERLRLARERLARRPLDSILAALATVVEEWLAPRSPWRERAQSLLPRATGFSPEMVEHALPFLIEPLRAPAPADLLDAELGDRRVLDGFAGRLGVRSPEIIVHVLSGNLPGLAAVPMAASLALKSAALVKVASGDRVFAALWARSVAETDLDLGASLAPVYWRGGDLECEAEAFARASVVVASGSDATIADARARCPTRFIGHGHKVSFAVVTKEVLRDAVAAGEAASSLAYDVALWDQMGCLSPQMCYVEGDFAAATAFAETLVAPFRELARRLPPGSATMEGQLAVQRFRQEAEWRGIAAAESALLVSEASLDWTLVVDADATLRPTPLHRSLRLVPFSTDRDLVHALEASRRFLEAAGIAAPAERVGALSELLSRAGVNRICPLGVMQRPPLSWRQGGRPRIGDWMEWSADEA